MKRERNSRISTRLRVRFGAVIRGAARLPGRVLRALADRMVAGAAHRKFLSYVGTGSGGWWPIIRESFAGAWQSNVLAARDEDVLANSATFACVTMITSDIGKLPLRLLGQNPDGTWAPASGTTPGGAVKLASKFPPELAAVPALLRKPNQYQTQQLFLESWIMSLALAGNAYIWPQRTRGALGDLIAFHVLNPARVMPCVSPSGDVVYKLQSDNLAGSEEQYLLADELIHSRINCLWHPLCGVSPLYAAALAGTTAVQALKNSKVFFGNKAQPGAYLTAPGPIGDDVAARLKASLAEDFTGERSGDSLVLGDGLKFETLAMTAEASQLIEQLQWTAVDVCRAFRVPPFMIGAAPPPPGLSIEALTQSYYVGVLQALIETVENDLDAGLKLPPWLRFELDVGQLLRMDTHQRYLAYREGMQAGWLSPNEIRRRENLPDVEGGSTPYLQVQNYSLAALARRDAQPDPFSTGGERAALREAEVRERAQKHIEWRDVRGLEPRSAGVTAADGEPRSGAGYLTRAVDLPEGPSPGDGPAKRRAKILARRRAAMRELFADHDEGGST